MHRHVNGPTMREKAKEFLENYRGFAEEQATQAKTFIQEKPILSALLGIGAGLMVGLMFSRRVPKIELVVRSKGKAS